MTTLLAIDQAFLAHHYGWASAAAALDGDPSKSLGGTGPNRAYFTSDGRGIHYTMPWETSPGPVVNAKGWITKYREAHLITWARLAAHTAAQPESLRANLAAARRESHAEYHRHRLAWDGISKNGYWKASDEQKAALDAEWARHMAALKPIDARVKAATFAMLPLRDIDPQEPADLIEWAEVLA